MDAVSCLCLCEDTDESCQCLGLYAASTLALWLAYTPLHVKYDVQHHLCKLFTGIGVRAANSPNYMYPVVLCFQHTNQSNIRTRAVEWLHEIYRHYATSNLHPDSCMDLMEGG